MSSLRKELFKGKGNFNLSEYKTNASMTEREDDADEVFEEIDEEEEGKSKVGSLPTTFIKPRSRGDYTVIPWETCFDGFRDIKIENSEDVFRAYEIHSTIDRNAPLFVFHHGAGYSGLSFALAASHVKQLMNGKCAVFSYDCRGHGLTKTSDDNNLSLDKLSQDLVNVLKAAFEDIAERDVFLIGHSMGGCVVSHVASKKLIPSTTCIAVIDVVEGSAMDAFKGIQTFIRTRKNEFESVDRAIEWSVNSGTIHNLDSSRISIPSLLRKEGTKHVWRTDLSATQQYWEGWFVGLSEKFLSTSAAKLLILASTDRLDNPLTIAQMQGKYQLLVFPDVGHMIQEDAPEKTASALVEFWKRNEKLILPVKPFVANK